MELQQNIGQKLLISKTTWHKNMVDQLFKVESLVSNLTLIHLGRFKCLHSGVIAKTNYFTVKF